MYKQEGKNLSSDFKNPVRHPEFAKRIQYACDGLSDLPPIFYGRLTWFHKRLSDIGVDVSIETVRKWLNGESLPRKPAMAALAQILKVDAPWLANGAAVDFTAPQKKAAFVVAGAAVNLVAGFIQLDGAHPAFPDDDDADAKDRKINLYAIIRGAKYSFHITPIATINDVRQFLVPAEAESNVVLGLVPAEGFAVRIYEMDWEKIKAEITRKGGFYHVPLEGFDHREITSFAERI